MAMANAKAKSKNAINDIDVIKANIRFILFLEFMGLKIDVIWKNSK